MKRSLLILAGSWMLILQAPSAVSAQKRADLRLNRVSYSGSETSPDKALEKAILREIPHYAEEMRAVYGNRPEAFASYFYNRVDLNRDGKPEVLVWLNGLSLGGSSGYPVMVFQKAGRGYKSLWSVEQVWIPIIVSQRRTKGWSDLIIRVGGGGYPLEYALFKFNGKSYSGTASDIKKSRIAGRAFIADDYMDDSGFKGIDLKP
jgi:hypothetical protein